MLHVLKNTWNYHCNNKQHACGGGLIAGEIACENLDKDSCAFAVSSSGKRCVLEKHVKRSGKDAYTCGTSEIEADKLKNWVETDQCIKACGLDRKSLGISSDSLLDTTFTQKLCSPQCYDSCPNIVDLFFNLAAGEGNSNHISFSFSWKLPEQGTSMSLVHYCQSYKVRNRPKYLSYRGSRFPVYLIVRCW